MDTLPIGFATPWWLAGLALLLLLPRGPGRPWRAGALACLLLALAGPTLPRPAERAAVLVDVSDSVGNAALEAARELDLDGLPAPPRVWHVAGDASEASGLDEPPREAVRRDRTDLARALGVAAGGDVGRVLLVSDGRATRGDASAALPDVPVDVLPVASRDNARLAEVRAPPSAAPGETVSVEAVVDTDRAGPVRLRPTLDGEPLPVRERQVEAGTHSFTLEVTLPEGGPVRLGATVEVPWSQPGVDDEASAEVALAERPSVLVVGDPATAELLRVQGFDVREGGVEAVDAELDASAVVLRASSTRFTPGQLERLQRYVDDGGGLLMTGGPDSFGLGGWYRTPVEAVLPVDTDLRTEVQVPLVGMVMVVDRSQSMATGSPSKIELARQGASDVVELAYQQDLLGMVAFSDSAQWVFDLRPATRQGKREMLASIRALDTQGGTILGPAYEQALEALDDSEASIKHVIVLSDGKLYDGRGPFGDSSPDFTGLARDALDRGITTTTIAIGASADFGRLRSIADAGGGRYYEALDASTLPSIFADEALTATRSLLREEVGAVEAHAHPLLSGEARPPAPSAYVATSLKSDAEPLWTSDEGEPLLAVRRQGLGRTAALTTDLNAWAGELGAWDPLPAVLGTVVRWLQARPDRFTAALETRDGDTVVTVDAVEDGRYVDGRALWARLGGEEVPFEQVGPGRYRAALPADLEGNTVLVTDGNEVVSRVRRASAPPEFAEQDGEGLLRELAERSGGTVLEPEARYAPDLQRSPRSVAWWPALAGALLLLGELTWRRFAPGSRRAA